MNQNAKQEPPKGDKAIIEREQRFRDEYNAPGWHKGPAQGGPNHWYDGDTLLIAVETSKGWDFGLVGISADEESARLVDEYGDSYTDWGFDQLSYWIHKRDIPALITPASAPTDATGEAGEGPTPETDAAKFFLYFEHNSHDWNVRGQGEFRKGDVVPAEVCAKLERTIATLRAECEGLRAWQPIETAPKTTLGILVHCKEIRCTFAVWWESASEHVAGRGWVIFGGHGEKLHPIPTHWKPMPEPPPASRATEGQG